jgi:quinol monooxygenase YgiN
MLALVVRFEVKPEMVAEFDLMMSRTLDGIREQEGGTLLYFTARVADDPCSRVFVEVYADDDAFAAHERYPHTRRFLQDREPMIDSYRVEFLDPIDGKFPNW